MTSGDPTTSGAPPTRHGPPPLRAGDDCGLLTPGTAGSAVHAATGDTALLRAMLDAEAALIRAQARTGQAPQSAADTITAVTSTADPATFDARDLATRARDAGNPVVPLVADLTRAVAARDPDAADHVHRGATSQDILDTAMMLVTRHALGIVLADLDRAAAALARLAAHHRDTPMPARTLTQHAVPTTFGLKAAGWRSLVLDARDRLDSVRGALPVQLGGAGGTLAAFHAYAPPSAAGRHPEDDDPGLRLVTAYAAETGLAEPALPWHALRTPVADLGAALALTAGALGKTAADVLVLSRTEIGEVAEGSGGGSSAMPHKDNPVRATLIAAAARQVPALACVLLGALAAEDERPAGSWHAEWQPLRQALRLVGGAARDTAELTEGLRVHPGAMRKHLALTEGRITSERLTAALTPLLGRARARDAVTAAARRAHDTGTTFEAELLAHPALSTALTPDRLRDLLDPAAYLGSAAPLTERALRRAPRAEATSPEER